MQKILSFDLEDLEYIQRKLQIYLESLTCRLDILDSLSLRDWLRLPISSDSPPIKPIAVSEFQANSQFTATCFSRYLNDGILVVGFGDMGANSSFNVWNLLDATPKGAFVVIPVTNEGLEGTMVTFSCAEEVTSCVLLRHGELFLGLRSGEVLWTHLSNLHEGGQWKSEIVDQVKMHGALVRGMAALERDDLVLSVSIDNCLRVFGPRHGKIEMLGGGSLRARLQDIHLTQVAVDGATGEVYLGTDSNRVLIYRMEGPKPVYVSMILTRGIGPIGCVQVSESAILIGDGSELESLSPGKKLVGSRQMTVFALLESTEAECLMTCCANGMIVQWDPVTSHIRSAFNVSLSKIVHLLLSFPVRILLSLSDDGKITVRVQSDLEASAAVIEQTLTLKPVHIPAPLAVTDSSEIACEDTFQPETAQPVPSDFSPLMMDRSPIDFARKRKGAVSKSPVSFAYNAHFDPAVKFLKTLDSSPLTTEVPVRKQLTHRPTTVELTSHRSSPRRTKPVTRGFHHSSSALSFNDSYHSLLGRRPLRSARKSFEFGQRSQRIQELQTQVDLFVGKPAESFSPPVSKPKTPNRAPSVIELPVMEYYRRLNSRPERSIRTPNTNQKRVASNGGYRTKFQKDPVIRRSALGMYEYIDCYDHDEVYMKKLHNVVNKRNRETRRRCGED